MRPFVAAAIRPSYPSSFQRPPVSSGSVDRTRVANESKVMGRTSRARSWRQADARLELPDRSAAEAEHEQLASRARSRPPRRVGGFVRRARGSCPSRRQRARAGGASIGASTMPCCSEVRWAGRPSEVNVGSRGSAVDSHVDGRRKKPMRARFSSGSSDGTRRFMDRRVGVGSFRRTGASA